MARSKHSATELSRKLGKLRTKTGWLASVLGMLGQSDIRDPPISTTERGLMTLWLSRASSVIASCSQLMASRFWASMWVYLVSVTKRGSMMTRIAAPIRHRFCLRAAFSPNVLPQKCDQYRKKDPRQSLELNCTKSDTFFTPTPSVYCKVSLCYINKILQS